MRKILINNFSKISNLTQRFNKEKKGCNVYDEQLEPKRENPTSTRSL